jgi:glycosyltransferase involved in cell wall biosynthesis
MKVLWFSNTPGLANEYLKGKSFGGGWIDALQSEVEKASNCELGLVFYVDQVIDNFNFGNTSYFPVQRKFNTKLKRYKAKIVSKVEYDENVENFLAIINEFKPDIIHVHGTESPFGLIIKKTKIPIAISIQGNLNVYKGKYFSGIEYSTIAKGLKSLMGKIVLEYRSFTKKAIIESEILKEAKYIFGRTDWDRRITRVLAPQSKYFLIDEMMRPCFYGHQWLPKKDGMTILFTTSSDSLYKGFEVIIETAILLKKNNFRFEWFVAGLSLHDELARFSMKLNGVSDLESIGIKLMGMVNAETILEKMLSSTMYVQVSHIENSPNSVCEAMLLGMPIIASYVGGTPSIVKDNETGLLIQDGDSLSLAGSIIELSAKNELAESFGKAAFKIARERHDGKRIFLNLMNAYSEIINNQLIANPELLHDSK